MKEQDESYYQALLEAEMKKCAELARQLAEEAQMNR